MLARVSQAQLRGSRHSNSVDVRDDFQPARFSRPGHVLLLFLFISIDSFQINCLNIYRADLRQICRVGGTMALDDHYEISFSIPQGTLPWQPIFVGLMHRIEFR